MFTAGTIERPSFGRNAVLGSLFDARIDQFLPDVNLLSALEDDHICRTNKFESIEVFTDDRSRRGRTRANLEIDSESKLSLYCGRIPLTNTISVLESKKESVQNSKLSCYYKVQTRHEEFEFSSSKDRVNQEMLKSIHATHVVVGITKGMNCAFTCETEIPTNLNAVKKKVISIMSRLSAQSIPCVTDFIEKNKIKKGDKLTLMFATDVGKILNIAIRYFDIDKILSSTNDWNDIPVSFVMLPLQSVMFAFGVQGETVIYKPITDEMTVQFMQEMKRSCCAQASLDKLRESLENDRVYISDKIFNEITFLEKQFADYLALLKGRFDEKFTEIRSGKLNGTEFQIFVKYFMKMDNCLEKIEKQLKTIEDRYEKHMGMVNFYEDRNIKYIGRQSLNLPELASKFESIYIHYLKSDIDDDSDNSHDNTEMPAQTTWSIFMRLKTTMNNDVGKQFVVVDKIFNSEILQDQVGTIELHRNGVTGTIDLSDDDYQMQESYIKVLNATECRSIPASRVPLELKCPASYHDGKCSSDSRGWNCLKCKDAIEYGVKSDTFYCKCGKFFAKDAQFRCTDYHHGMEFMSYEANLLKENLKMLHPDKEMNILILGETGVGKSTWINGIANYLQFDTLQDATAQRPMISVIPSEFTFTDENDEQICIKVGEKNDNERIQAGESATQQPQSYSICTPKHHYRIIDTPGIGDTRGIDQDKKNFDLILAHLSHYDEIHGICILLKPNNARMTTLFRFCINELLTHLHKSAAENIVFCFTNARSTFYRPGDTLPVLKKLLHTYKDANIKLTKENKYCFDNEAFRFLACVQHGIEFEETDVATYSTSWTKAKQETTRLINYIGQLKPHRIIIHNHNSK